MRGIRIWPETLAEITELNSGVEPMEETIGTCVYVYKGEDEHAEILKLEDFNKQYTWVANEHGVIYNDEIVRRIG